MSTEELLAEALRLSRRERARLAEELLISLEETEESVVSAWADILDRRSREVSEGRVRPVTWATAREQIHTELERRRAARAPS
ncbi:MAG: addiction module protein [Thermoanaerobaculia bacterium]